MSKLRGWAVVESCSTGILNISAYNKAEEAEQTFKELAADNEFTDLEILDGLEAGELKKDDYVLTIIAM